MKPSEAQNKAIHATLSSFRKEKKALGTLSRSTTLSAGEHNRQALAIEKKHGRDYWSGKKLK
jgi:hypothetical protein